MTMIDIVGVYITVCVLSFVVLSNSSMDTAEMSSRIIFWPLWAIRGTFRVGKILLLEFWNG